MKPIKTYDLVDVGTVYQTYRELVEDVEYEDGMWCETSEHRKVLEDIITKLELISPHINQHVINQIKETLGA